MIAVINKALKLNSMSLPLLLAENSNKSEHRTFTEALLDVIVLMDKKKSDYPLKVIRLTSENNDEIESILSVLNERFPPEIKGRLKSQSVSKN
jgi:hypothetical protein